MDFKITKLKNSIQIDKYLGNDKNVSILNHRVTKIANMIHPVKLFVND